MAARGAWEQALAWALRGRAEELAEAAPVALDTVSRALAEALDAARAGGQWREVGELAAALEARQAALRDVVSLDSARRRRGRQR